MKQTILLIRHGQSTWNIERRLPGHLPGVALTEEGRRQAQRLSSALAEFPISAVISSPLERARDTAQYLLHGRNLEMHFEPSLMDTNLGHWSGQLASELSKSDPAWSAYVQNPTIAPGGVETFPHVQKRVVVAIEKWRRVEDIGTCVAFVAHADVVRLVLAHYMGLEARLAGCLLIDNASVSILELEKERCPFVVAISWSPRPGWLKSPVLQEESKAGNSQVDSELGV